ncbi:AAA family ATPase [Streptomyces sp. NPDC006332]|uniref:helix-turn-helix transcriptional regulator n=1 Tax=Streptomyces sp. NPDC006332 TaxID=3155456 RepID=UPI0033AC8A8B
MTGPLHEREAAQALLAAEAERARAGNGRLVLLRGATGTGRTAVLEAASVAAAACGMRVLRGRCSPEDSGVPFAAVLHLLGSVPRFAEVTAGDDERGSAARLWRLLREYADEAPLLVAVDDVHLADDASRRWLVDAARRVDRLPVLLVATERSQYDVDPPAAGLAHALSPSLVRSHTLAPLTPTAAAELVRATFPSASPRWAADCWSATAGSPLLLRALLDDLGAMPPTALPPTLPDTSAALYPGAYPAAVQWWLDSAGPATSEVARALAALEPTWPARDVSGGPARALRGSAGNAPGSAALRFGPGPEPSAPAPDSVDLLAEAVGADPVRVAGWLTAMLRFGVLRADAGGRPCYAHPLLRDAVLAGWPVGRRQEVYLAAAEAMVRRGDAAEAVAGPLLRTRGYPHQYADVRPAHREHAPYATGPAPHADPPDPAPPALHADPPDPAPPAPHADPPDPAPPALHADPPDPAPPALHADPPDPEAPAPHANPPTPTHPALPPDDATPPTPADRTAGPPWVSRVLRDAARAALLQSRPRDAVDYLRRALEEPLDDDLRQRLLTELGSLEYAATDAPGIPRLAEALHLPARPDDRVRTGIALGTALARRGEVRAAVDVLRTLEDRLTGHPDLAHTVRTASALLSDHDHTIRQEAYRWLGDVVERSPEAAGPAGQALLVRYAATAGALSAEEAMARLGTLLARPAEALAEPFLLGTAAAVAQWADELDHAERLVERGLAVRHTPLLHPMERALLDVRTDIAAARGEYGRVLAEQGERAVPQHRTGPTNADAHAVIALVETGRTDAARRLADRFDPGRAPDSWEMNRFLYARGVLRLAEGDVTGALHDFLECGRRQEARAVVSPVVTPWRTAAAECRLALGRPREALALAEEELRLARVWNTPRTLGRALRVLGLATGGRRGLELAEEAVAVLRPAPGGHALVEALLTQGRLLTAAGERARGRDCLREAAERAERLGAPRLRTHVEEALRAGGARRSAAAFTGSRSLTGSESRIAELAANGRTNTEIAELLHIARRTVETHLTSTYRKLGIRSRAELRAALQGARG